MGTNEIVQYHSRREFGLGLMVAAAASSLPTRLFATEPLPPDHKICAFIKFLQELNYEQLADAIAAAGFNGVEATVREKEGYIHPAAAADELPKLREALAKRNLEINILTTDILDAGQPYAKQVLKTAAELKIPHYRLGFFRYDLKQPIINQLADFRPKIQELAALNRELGIAGIYQNHCGADFFGATLWDLHSLIKDYPRSEMSCVFDIRHASVEAGEAWSQLFNLMQPHIGAVSVKDYVWDGAKSKHVSLGKGRVDPEFFKLLMSSGFAGPISVHVEYLPKAGVAENLQALKMDLQVLKKMLAVQS
jgi:sugar phosphate isomerase/epimerase